MINGRSFTNPTAGSTTGGRRSYSNIKTIYEVKYTATLLPIYLIEIRITCADAVSGMKLGLNLFDTLVTFLLGSADVASPILIAVFIDRIKPFYHIHFLQNL